MILLSVKLPRCLVAPLVFGEVKSSNTCIRKRYLPGSTPVTVHCREAFPSAPLEALPIEMFAPP